MEEPRTAKCLRSRDPGQDGQPKSLDRPGVGDPDQADVLVQHVQPTKPFAYVKPIVREAPKLAEPVPLVERSRRRERRRRVRREHGGEGSHVLERGRRGRRSGLARGASSHAEIGHFMGPNFHRELDNYMEAETSQAPPAAFQATSTQGDTLQDSDPHTFQIGIRFQVLPDASGYWNLRESPPSGIYLSLEFRPLAGSGFPVVHAPSGIYVCGVPGFFTHIAH